MLGYRKKDNKFIQGLKKPIIPSVVLLTVFLAGTIGYSVLWKDSDGSVIDAIYMTVTTITTIGFGEIHPLDNTGKIFTMIIAVTGIGSLFYVLSVIMENLVIIQLQNFRGKKKMKKEIENLTNHIIVVGFGRVGKLTSKELYENSESFVVIEPNQNEKSEFSNNKYLIVEGDATEDTVLIDAGIQKARGIIITTVNSATTLFVVLSSKVLNPSIFIVARAEEESVVEKLKRAGADRVVNPYSIGGQRLARLMLNTNIIDFFDTSLGQGENNLRIENFNVSENSTFSNKTLKDIAIRQKTGASILAVIRDGNPNLNPGGNFLIDYNDQLIVLGTKKQLKELEDMFLVNIS